jgi:hypothetical protein
VKIHFFFERSKKISAVLFFCFFVPGRYAPKALICYFVFFCSGEIRVLRSASAFPHPLHPASCLLNPPSRIPHPAFRFFSSASRILPSAFSMPPLTPPPSPHPPAFAPQPPPRKRVGWSLWGWRFRPLGLLVLYHSTSRAGGRFRQRPVITIGGIFVLVYQRIGFANVFEVAWAIIE